MARTIRANKERSAQSWTRCRLPIERQIPYLHESLDVPASWLTPLEGLVKSPGFDYAVSLRNIHDAEDVIFVCYWKNDAFLESFRDSPTFQEYLQVFGFQDASTPGAFFSVHPAIYIWSFSKKVTIFTYSFTHPVPEENRDILYQLGGLEINRAFTTSPFRTSQPGRGWIREPQIGEHGQLVEKGMILQSWADNPHNLVPDMHEAVSKDEWAREILRQNVEEINPLDMEETTWAPCEETVEGVESEEGAHDEDRMDIEDVDSDVEDADSEIEDRDSGIEDVDSDGA